MWSTACVLVSVWAGSVVAQTQYTSTGTAAVAKARATALTESPTSNVIGKTFNRYVSICKDYCHIDARSWLIVESSFGEY
jgi:hypothetical protein